MSSTVNEIFNAALLSQAAYADDLDRLGLEIALKTVSGITDAQAEFFSDNFRVIIQEPTTETGFSATLFQNIHTLEYHLSVRGTDGFAGDVPEDIYNISAVISPRQNVDMINFYMRLISGTDVDVPQFIYQEITAIVAQVNTEVGVDQLIQLMASITDSSSDGVDPLIAQQNESQTVIAAPEV